MSRNSILRPRNLTAILLGFFAAMMTYLPPLEIGARLDGKLFDLWSRQFPSAGLTSSIILVDLDDPAWLDSLARLAEEDQARLLITTLPHPPSPDVNRQVLGPTELALGAALLRRTEWEHGGHLLFEPDADGLVRSEHPQLQDVGGLRSLALSAYQALNHDEAPIQGDQRIRFRDPTSFTRVQPDDLQGIPGLLTDRIVIAGRSTARYDTPIGLLSEHELLAQVISGYTDNGLLRNSIGMQALAWGFVFILLAGIVYQPRLLGRRAWTRLLPVVGSLGLLGLSSTAFAQADLWVPVAGPGTLLLTSSLLLLVRPRQRRAAFRGQVSPEAARELFDSGRLQEAWLAYRSMPPTQALFDELYALGSQLYDDGYLELAADTYHRIALVDVSYRDVAMRLIRATHRYPDGTGDAIAEQLRAEMPATLGRFVLLEPIGQGSTGRVYLARDPEINRLVAIKVINLTKEVEPAELEEAKDRFRREAETAGRLNHPNIVTIFDIGESDGLAYIAMEYLKGRHLSDFTSQSSLLPVPLVLELGALTADALDFAHAQNVVHRDIKPSNIMYDSVSGDLKITDFGIARLIDVSRTRTGVVLGTPSFMSPEQLEGGNVNGHTDLFALGVTLYELLTGRLPFRGASMTNLMFVIANEPHEPITAVRGDLPVELDIVIDTALNKEPGSRFQRGSDMADALRAVAVHTN